MRNNIAGMKKSVDVLFINPGDNKQIYQNLENEFSAIEPPALAGLFATFIRQKGMKVAIIDGPAHGMTANAIADNVVDEFNPILVAIVVYGFQPSASTQNMTAAGKIAKALKERNSNLKILMTGTHPAALPQRTMLEEAVDFVCDREGPVTIYKTVQALKAKIENFSDIPSLWWRQDEVVLAPRSSEGLIKDLDTEMPSIAWDLLPMDRYRAHNWHCFEHIHERSPYVSMHTSMGCPYHCSFCCINAPFGKSSYRMWSPETVVKEIDFLVENYGIKNIKFVDEMFVLNKRHVLGICDLLIQRDYKINIWAYARVDTVKSEFLDKLKAAGFNWLALGVESASEYVRDGAAKKLGDKEIIDTIQRIQDAGIYIIANYIFGLPDDTIERMQNTLLLALDLNCEFANMYSAMAYPGSLLYKTALESGADLPESWHQFSQHAYDSKPLSNQYCTSADILEFRDKAWNTYFTNPRYLDMIKEKFGQGVIEHINRMVAIPLQRKLVEEKYA